MATFLGKRKRSTSRSISDGDELSATSRSLAVDAQEIFRRHFEAQFKPLLAVKKVAEVVEEIQEDDSGEDSEWDGISGDEDAVQVVEHTEAQPRTTKMSKEELKAFMSSKPPATADATPSTRDKAGTAIADDDPSEAANLKKDLALQRLLTESHLLDSSSTPTLSGNNRHKATDMRLQALGSKTSILKQEKMPMAQRKGIAAKQAQREDTRRREAKENGIILERAKMSVKQGPVRKRDRGVGAPAIGKFTGGTLKLSKKDISSIEGPKRSISGRGGRGGGRGRDKRRL